MNELRKIYESRLPALQRGKSRLESVLLRVAAGIEDKRLVRAEVRTVRIKELSSVQRKAEKNGWGTSEVPSRCGDLVGGRVICNNMEDVYRFSVLRCLVWVATISI
jgi:ppGpp synthetase/RelA/SpoT-type nucleotidyltranferase